MLGGKAGNLAMMAAMTKPCLAKKPGSEIYCVMAAQSAMQAGKDGSTAKDARNAGSAFTSNWAGADLGNGLTGAAYDAKLLDYENQLNSGIDKIQKANPKIDIKNDKIGTPKGSVALSSLGSGSAMAAAGLISAEQIAEVDALIKKRDEFKIPAMSASTGGGGGGGSSGKTAEYKMPSFEMPRDPASTPAAPVAAGLVKLANGEPIGTASDNIFNMLHNRYQQKVKEKMFVGSEPSTN